MTEEDPLAPRPFRPLGDYAWPSVPTDETVQRMWNDLLEVFDRKEQDSPLVSSDRLGHLGGDRLDEIAAPPACQPILDDMTLTYGAWLADTDVARRLQVVVTPPGSAADIVTVWAEQHDLALMPAPDRHLLPDTPGPDAPDLSGEGVLVLPQLETWFLRDADGLSTARALLEAVMSSDRRILVGCNSWAWAYLSKAVNAALLLPTAQTFQAFDGDRLRAWFADLAAEARAEGRIFRLSATGADIFAAEGDDAARDYFTRLAGRSLGIPWIAWSMWRGAISDFRPEAEEDEDLPKPDLEDENTYWIDDSQEFSIPASNRRSALLTLHALLIHGSLAPDLLHRVLPQPDTDAIVPALVDADLVLSRGRGDGATRLRINPLAYPTIRAALGNAGFPQDRL